MGERVQLGLLLNATVCGITVCSVSLITQVFIKGMEIRSLEIKYYKMRKNKNIFCFLAHTDINMHTH